MEEKTVNQTTNPKRQQRHVRALAYGAVCLAMSIVLARVMPSYRLAPHGPSISIASLAPLFLYIYLFGFKYGALITIAYTAVLTATAQPGNLMGGPFQVMLDYLIPYMSLVLIALVPKVLNKNGNGGKLMEIGIYIGLTIFALIRWFSQSLSGMIFWSAPSWGFSLFFNSPGLIDAAIAAIVLVALFRSKAFVKELQKIQEFQNGGKKLKVSEGAVQAEGVTI